MYAYYDLSIKILHIYLKKKIIPYQWRKFHKAYMYACILCFTIEIHDPPQTIPNISAQFNLYQKLLILWTKLYLKYTKTFIWKRYYQILHPPPFPHHQTHVHNQQEFTFINQTINSLRQSVCFILVNEGDLKLCSITHVLFTSAPCKPAWTDQRCDDAFRQSTPIGQLWLVFFHYMSIT